MDKLEYIQGDLVKFSTNTYTIVNFEENFLHNKICYALISTNSTKTAFVADRDILPIPLTPEILEKNGWDKERYGLVYYKKVSETLFFRLIGKSYGWTLRCGNQNLIEKLVFVHQLQNLLFGLGLKHKMEV
jgi:hypothetical protein|nr:MAG: hypothetical protein [Bacteriophage sp.]DAV75371.1 MAG TPA: hypothetical protein [Caudoviricetes sp.]